MLDLSLGGDPTAPLRILCLGAHSDDIEIGCGGTILRLLSERPGSSVQWVVFSADDRRDAEARSSAQDFLAAAAQSEVEVFRFAESYFPTWWSDIKRAFEELKTGPRPDLVLTHRRHDDHQDHRTVGELTWNTFRDHLILEYEIPKYEGDLGQPNVYVPLSDEIAERKVTLLAQHFGSQSGRPWFRPETFRGLMNLRSIECGSTTSAAEAFHARKLRL